MTTATRGLVRYEGVVTDANGDFSIGSAWQDQVDRATSAMATASAGFRRAPGAISERQLSRYLAAQSAKRRRVSATKLAVIMIGEVIALAAGCYIGLIA